MPHAARRLLPCLLAASLLAAAHAPAQAQYTWRDAKGQLHASDQPPPRDIPDKDVIRKPAPRPAAAPVPAPGASAAAGVAGNAPVRSAASAPVDPELQQRRARAEQEAKAKAQAEEQRLAAQRATNCQRARDHLATIENGGRLVRAAPNGERVVLDDAARAQEAAQARSVIASECR